MSKIIRKEGKIVHGTMEDLFKVGILSNDMLDAILFMDKVKEEAKEYLDILTAKAQKCTEGELSTETKERLKELLVERNELRDTLQNCDKTFSNVFESHDSKSDEPEYTIEHLKDMPVISLDDLNKEDRDAVQKILLAKVQECSDDSKSDEPEYTIEHIKDLRDIPYDSKLEDLVQIADEVDNDYLRERCLELADEVAKDDLTVTPLSISCLVGDGHKLLVNGINCNMKRVKLNKCILVTNIGISITNMRIDENMDSLDDAEVNFEICNIIPEINHMMTIRIDVLIDLGLAMWIADDVFEMEMSPLEYRGITKLCDVTEIDPSLGFKIENLYQ